MLFNLYLTLIKPFKFMSFILKFVSFYFLPMLFPVYTFLHQQQTMVSLKYEVLIAHIQQYKSPYQPNQFQFFLTIINIIANHQLPLTNQANNFHSTNTYYQIKKKKKKQILMIIQKQKQKKNKYNLRIKKKKIIKKMSISLVNKIIERQKQNEQKYNIHYQNKQNRQQNRKKQKSGRHRNDHSIQVKSPFKIPPRNNNNKQDLTFRNSTDNSVTPSQQLQPPSSSNLTIGVQPSLLFNKQQMKINIEKIGGDWNGKKGVFTKAQCQLIDNLWQICTRLSDFHNQFIEQPLSNIQLQIKKMLTIIAQQNLYNEAPLASSKKIKLQNCLTLSQCQKQINHKQFQSQQSRLQNNQYIQPIFSGKTTSSIYTCKTQPQQNKQFKFLQIQAKQQLQVKKIMYMLDGKNKNNSKICLNKNQTYLSNNSLSSLSSFNQNSNQQSGVTVYQIQRCSQRSSQISKNKQQPYQNCQSLQKGFKKSQKNHYFEQQSQQPQNTRMQTEICQSYSSRSQNIDNYKNVYMGNKRKVLNDIVAMLNLKYNKNIRLD